MRLPQKPSCLAPAVFVAVWGPVLGFFEPSSGGAKSAQLTGWGETDGLTWQGAPVETLLDTDVFFSFLFYSIRPLELLEAV